MEIRFSQRKSVKLFRPCGCQPWGILGAGVLVRLVNTSLFLTIRLACAYVRYPYKGEMRSEGNRLRGREAVGERITRISQVSSPARHKQETHRESRKIICPKDFNLSRPKRRRGRGAGGGGGEVNTPGAKWFQAPGFIHGTV